VDPPNGKVPYQPWAAEQKKANFEHEIDPLSFCLPTGVPRAAYPPGGYQIVQTSGYVLLLLDASHDYRIIPLDGSPHVGRDIHLWMGDSRGHWEGNTLVVDVTNTMGDKTWLDVAGNFYTEGGHVVERFTRVDPDTLRYEATITDPKTFTQPLKMATTLKRNNRKGYELLETACVEGDRDIAHLRAAYAQKSGKKN
jgi:hypothetical protein